MRSDLPHLAFDTAGPHVAVHLTCKGIANRFVPMERGQAERLPEICAEVLGAAGLDWRDLRSASVGVGPGNFTGVRIAVSFARGLALGLGIPAVGVTGFEAAHLGIMLPGRVLVSLPAPRDQAYVQEFTEGGPIAPPVLLTPGDAPEALRGPNLWVLGHRAEEIAQGLDARYPDLPKRQSAREGMIAADVASVALEKLRRRAMDGDGPWAERPAPLYVRAPDAAPQREAPPVLIG